MYVLTLYYLHCNYGLCRFASLTHRSTHHQSISALSSLDTPFDTQIGTESYKKMGVFFKGSAAPNWSSYLHKNWLQFRQRRKSKPSDRKSNPIDTDTQIVCHPPSHHKSKNLDLHRHKPPQVQKSRLKSTHPRRADSWAPYFYRRAAKIFVDINITHYIYDIYYIALYIDYMIWWVVEIILAQIIFALITSIHRMNVLNQTDLMNAGIRVKFRLLNRIFCALTKHAVIH